MSTALDPNITPLLAYAVVAVLVIISFVGAILVVLGRVRKWLRTAFEEFTESSAFESTIERILDRIGEKMLARASERMTLIERRDEERAESVRRTWGKIDDLGARTDKRIDDLFTAVMKQCQGKKGES